MDILRRKMFARYAQEYGGQKVHIVQADANTKTVSMKAICGRTPTRRGNWRMTINMPLGNCCGNCRRFARGIVIINF